MTAHLGSAVSVSASRCCSCGACECVRAWGPCIVTVSAAGAAAVVHQPKKKHTHRSDITPDPGGHWPQRPCAQGRTGAKQDQAQASAPGQNRTQFGGGATTHGRRTRQAGKSVPTQTRSGAGGCTPQSTPQEGTLQQDPNGNVHTIATRPEHPAQPVGHPRHGVCRQVTVVCSTGRQASLSLLETNDAGGRRQWQGRVVVPVCMRGEVSAGVRFSREGAGRWDKGKVLRGGGVCMYVCMYDYIGCACAARRGAW